MRRRVERLSILALSAAIVFALSSSVGSGGAATLTFAPTDDTYASFTDSTTAQGSRPYIKVRADSSGSPKRGFLKFAVSGLSGPVTSATLRVYSNWNSASGIQVRSADTAWSEQTLTWVNAPAYSPMVTSASTSYPANVWISLDVTPLITGNGIYSFALTTPNGETQLASKEGGTATAPQLVVQTSGAPSNTSPPSVSGTAQDGQTLNASPGSWSGDQPIGFTYQWRRCDGSGAGCADISGAGGQSYTLTSADVGSTIRVAVTGSNGAGSSSASSAATAAVAAATPSNTSPPSVSGTAQAGQTLSASAGNWNGTPPIGFAYQWRRCDSGGGSCADISGAGGQSYTLTSADVGSTIRVTVTGSNAAGSSSASSDPTQVVQAAAPAPPSNTSPPSISGTAQNGQTLSASPGNWNGTPPIGFAYQWRRCDSGGGSCADISGASGQSYTLSSADVGSTIRVTVTGSNSGGSSSASSDQTQVVQAAAPTPPANTSPPSVTGTAQDGQTLNASTGSWSGTPPIGFAYQWRRCDSGGGSCADINGASGQSYMLGSADVGSTIRVTVTGSNAAGSSSASSAATSVVAAVPPSNISPPSVSGMTQYGQTLTASAGSWGGTLPIGFAYQWRRCDSGGGGCADISGASGQSYTLTSTDIGSTLRVTVTGSNSGGSSSASSAATSVVSAADPVIGAAGDIACDPADSNFNGGLGTASACHEKAVSDLLVQSHLTAVLGLGDEQYECAGLSAFASSYDPTWGRLKAMTYPATGNHEYQTSGGTNCDSSGNAGGYFTYFGAAAGDPTRGYYSFDLGTWHLIALNASCAKVGGCGAGSPQEVWLRNDLAAHSNLCTLAFWHNPRYSSGGVGNDSTYSPFWQDLYNANAELVLVGHDHEYERFAPQNASSGLDTARGIREFVVGTGGKTHTSFATIRANSEVRNNDTFGFLKLTLHPSSYDWQFVPEPGKTFTDSGSTACH
ncbi:MAG: DNRLRE domain-containing protein [Actinomycetota bacterium]|nr:DNRLRE domain-containing protein [Actinomycetota bacterium]